MNKIDSNKWDDKIAELYDNYCRLSGNVYSVNAEEMIRHFPHHFHERVIDLACGTGMVSSTLMEKKPERIKELIAVDASEDMLRKYIQNLSHHKVRIEDYVSYAEDIHELPIAPVDSVLCGYGIWHFNLDTALKNISSRLRPGGYFVFSFFSNIFLLPNQERISPDFYDRIEDNLSEFAQKKGIDHNNMFGRKIEFGTLEKKLSSNGMRIQDMNIIRNSENHNYDSAMELFGRRTFYKLFPNIPQDEGYSAFRELSDRIFNEEGYMSETLVIVARKM